MATDVKYLNLLRDGEKPLNVLASHLGLPTKTITSVVEPYLIRAGFMEKGTHSKRSLTAQGREHLRIYHTHDRRPETLSEDD